MGRIVSEYDSADASFNNTYVYDAFGQLIRENNKSLDKTFIYEYNEIGNIIAAKTYTYTTGDIGNPTPESTDTYSYDTTHKDRLTTFNGSPISYNTTGCPSSYQGVAWSWKNGRLDTISNGAFANGKSYSFTYDGYGRLKQKQYNYFPGLGVLKDYLSKKTTTYTYDSSGRLVYEYRLLQYSDNTNTYRKFTYLYDESGIVGVVYNNNGEEQTYHYSRNIKGDVIGIFDVNGAEIVKYSYDSWGNFEITTGSLTNIAKDNPMLYRGYYYDHDTELYLLDARFYNPKWRRFISPDAAEYIDPETPNGLNLYAYCGNDPVNRFDPTGYDWEWSTFWTGLFMVGTAITAIALSVTTFGAGIPLAMSIVAGVTLGAGVFTGINGVATMIEAGTDYNFVRDGLFNSVLGLSDSAYNIYADVTEGVAMVGSMILGFYHTTGQYKAAKASQQYLGKGYTKADKNRWVSKDGYRQVRWDTTHHMYKGKKSPVHFNWYEYKYPIAKGVRNELIKDVHVWLKWFSYYS